MASYEMLALPLTAGCNLNCKFCMLNGIRSNFSKTYSNSLSSQQVKTLRSLITKADKIDFGGLTYMGEPILCSDFCEIIDFISSCNEKCELSLTTNAHLLKGKASDAIARSNFKKVTFSLHSPCAELYEEIQSKNFEKVVHNIETFCSKNSHIPTCINFGIGKFNSDHAVDMVHLASELGVDSVFFYPYYNAPNGFNEDQSLYDELDSLPRLYQRCSDAAKSLGISVEWRNIENYKVHDLDEIDASTCSVPGRNFYLRSAPLLENKMIYSPCHRLPLYEINIGRVDEEDWNWLEGIDFKERLFLDDQPLLSLCEYCKTNRIYEFRRFDSFQGLIPIRKKSLKEAKRRLAEFKASPSGAISLISDTDIERFHCFL